MLEIVDVVLIQRKAAIINQPVCWKPLLYRIFNLFKSEVGDLSSIKRRVVFEESNITFNKPVVIGNKIKMLKFKGDEYYGILPVDTTDNTNTYKCIIDWHRKGIRNDLT